MSVSSTDHESSVHRPRPAAGSRVASCGDRRRRRTRSRVRPPLDGRGESIWDRFCARPGAISDGSSGAVACDHYHRFGDDIALMKRLNLNAYRFSIAWPRVLPEGRGQVNERGLDFYDRLVDALLAAGIRPLPTLYHWDLPQALGGRGWLARSGRLPRRSPTTPTPSCRGSATGSADWMTLNEPFVSANHGYLTGEHAPGRSSLSDYLAASHHLLRRPRHGDGTGPRRGAGRARSASC